VAEHRYARLTETVNVSEDFADLANEDPLAAVVYAMTWTKCWPWAILPGKPMEFKATVCPLLDIGRERMQAILDALDRRGCIIGYEAPDGTLLRFSCQWHKHNPVKWQMVSLPKYAPPPSWEPPAAFIEWVSQHPQDTMAKWWKRQTVTNGYNGLQTKPAEATGGADGGQSTLAVAVDVDVTAQDQDQDQDSAPPAADAKQVDDPEPEHKEKTRAKSAANVAFESCLGVFSVSPDALDKAAWATFAKAMNALVGQTSVEQVAAWAEQEGAGSRKLGTGAKPQSKVPQVVRREVMAGEQQGAFAKARGASGGNGRYILCPDGSKQLEKDWTPEDALWVSVRTAEGKWDNERGMDREDERHPEFAGGIGI
jgi:hypothetical protein